VDTLPRAARLWAACYVVTATAHLGAQLAGTDRSAAVERFADVTQWFLMPLLALAVLAATRWPRGRQVTATLVALGMSFLGDTAPDLVDDTGDLPFLVMVGCFLGAQVAYVVAFAPDARRSVIGRPVRLVPYGAALVLLMAAVAPYAGGLLVPVSVYGGVLVAMAVLATGLGAWGTAGGALFLLSDSLIALRAFVPGWSLPADGFLVMATYCAGQAFLAVAVVRANQTARRRPAVASGAAASGAAASGAVAQPMPWTGAASGTPDPSRRVSTSGSATG
jgi:uncharacterized membrane protein YhhN